MKYVLSFSVFVAWFIWTHKVIAFNCITWDVIGDDLYLIYRTDDFSKSVTLKYNNGNVKISCSFKKSSYRCNHIPTFAVIHLNLNKKEIIFTIKDYNSTDVDGTWSISQGGKTFSTIVSLSNGYRESTDIHITGEANSPEVTLMCYSCRAPYGYNVEFLINGISEDSLTLNLATGKCTHQTGECNPKVCSCSLSGNLFIRTFYLNNASKTAHFACDFMFVDIKPLSRFSKCATVYYNGTEFDSKETKIEMKNSSVNNNKKKDDDVKDFKGTLIRIVLPVVILFIVTIVTVVILLYKNKTSRTNNKAELSAVKDSSNNIVDVNRYENIPLIPSSNKTASDQIAPQVNKQVDEYVAGNDGTEVNETVQTTEDALSPQKNNQVAECVIENDRTQAKETVQTSEDKVVPPLNNQVGNDITQRNENVQTSEDQLAPKMKNQDDESVIENDRTQANETVQTSEEEPNTDRSKQMPNSPTRPVDVVFINFDVEVERNWVKRVVDMLHDQYDLVCGLISIDVLLGLQMDNSFEFIVRNKPVVVTFSEMSCRKQPVIGLFENIDKLVVVMVEECSPPIFGNKMRCVDATLDEKMWMKQLFTALGCQTYVEM